MSEIKGFKPCGLIDTTNSGTVFLVVVIAAVTGFGVCVGLLLGWIL